MDANFYCLVIAQDLYVYLSESEHFTDFQNPKSLVWSKEDLTYGDWYSGPEKDGSYMTSFTFPTSQVIFYFISLNAQFF